MHSSLIATILAFAASGAHAAGTTYNGIASYYWQSGAAGSCGQTHSDGDYIVAVSKQLPHNAYCGQTVTIKNTGGGGNSNYGVGKSITATVADTCWGCDPDHLDLSAGAFEALIGGQLALGTFNIQWHFN